MKFTPLYLKTLITEKSVGPKRLRYRHFIKLDSHFEFGKTGSQWYAQQFKYKKIIKRKNLLSLRLVCYELGVLTHYVRPPCAQVRYRMYYVPNDDNIIMYYRWVEVCVILRTRYVMAIICNCFYSTCCRRYYNL